MAANVLQGVQLAQTNFAAMTAVQKERFALALIAYTINQLSAAASVPTRPQAG